MSIVGTTRGIMRLSDIAWQKPGADTDTGGIGDPLFETCQICVFEGEHCPNGVPSMWTGMPSAEDTRQQAQAYTGLRCSRGERGPRHTSRTPSAISSEAFLSEWKRPLSATHGRKRRALSTVGWGSRGFLFYPIPSEAKENERGLPSRMRDKTTPPEQYGCIDQHPTSRSYPLVLSQIRYFGAGFPQPPR
jgi:hypothetical protein